MTSTTCDMAPKPETDWIKACEYLATMWRRKNYPQNYSPIITTDELKTLSDFGLLYWASFQDADLNQEIARLSPRISSCLCLNDSFFKKLMLPAFDWSTRVNSRIMNDICLYQREILMQLEGRHCPHYNIIRYSFSVEETFDEKLLSASMFKKYKQWLQDLLKKLSWEGQIKFLETQITIWRFFDPNEMVYKESMECLDVKGLGEADAAIINYQTLPVHSVPTTIEGPLTILDAARLKRVNKPFHISTTDLKTCSDVKLLRLAALGNTCTNENIARLSPQKVQCICSSITLCTLPNEPFDWAKRVLDNDMNDICHLMANSLPPNVKSALCPHRNIMMLEYSNDSILNDSIPGFWLEMDQFQAYKNRLNKILSHLSEEGQKIVCLHPCKFWLVWNSKDETMILLWDHSKVKGLGEDDTNYIKDHVPHPIKGMMNTWWTNCFPSSWKRWQKAEICGQKTISRANVILKDPIDEMEEILKNL